MANQQTLSHDVISILPLIYVGWSDSMLSPTEVKIIHQQISEMSHLSKEDKEYLLQWVNPLSPPTEKEFKLWASEIRFMAADMDESTKRSLVDLGVEISKKGRQNGSADKDTILSLIHI